MRTPDRPSWTVGVAKEAGHIWFTMRISKSFRRSMQKSKERIHHIMKLLTLCIFVVVLDVVEIFPETNLGRLPARRFLRRLGMPVNV